MSFLTIKRNFAFLLIIFLSLTQCLISQENLVNDDWPAFRQNAQRSSSSKIVLSDNLKLSWARKFPALVPAWLDDASEAGLLFDVSYHPIVVDKTLFLASSGNDCLYAISTESGDILWKYYAEAPIRFAPVANKEKIYFVSDDSHLYCLNIKTGELVWKFRGAPNDSKVIANSRISSMWVARGGPTIDGQKVFFAAGIWPFMGTFVYAIDKDSGKCIWSNTGSGAIFRTQGHQSPAFAGLAPQGYLSVGKEIILVPNGRSHPAGLNKETGKTLFIPNKSGGIVAPISEKLFFFAGNANWNENSNPSGDLRGPYVFNEDFIYSGSLQANDLKNITVQEPVTSGGKTKPVLPLKLLWNEKIKTDIQFISGNRLYGTSDKTIHCYDLPETNKSITVPTLVKTWVVPEGNITELIAADHKLWAVTLEGHLYCFADEKLVKNEVVTKSEEIKPLPATSSNLVDPLYEICKTKEGYAVVLGIGTGAMIEQFVGSSKFNIVVVESDSKLVEKFRKKWDENGLYGNRIVIITDDPFNCALPPYLANIVVAENISIPIENLAKFTKLIFSNLRPYGGTAVLKLTGALKEKFQNAIKENKLEKAVVSTKNEWTLLTREGQLAGASNWTHHYGDATNSVASKDVITKLPLGVLWFGGISPKKIHGKHGHAPNPGVSNGRVITQGPDSMQAYDAYTGRSLWEKEFKGIGDFYKNRAHQPGASAIGSNYVSMPDFIYVAYQGKCQKLDAATGNTLDTYVLPPLTGGKEPAKWGYIAVSGDYLIAGLEPLHADKATPGEFTWNATSSKGIAVLNRFTGKLLWAKEAKTGFRHNAIVVGNEMVFAIDLVPETVFKVIVKENADGVGSLNAMNLKTGELVWSTTEGIFGTWLGYSEEHDILIQGGRASRDMLKDEVNNRMSAIQGKTGKLLWDLPNSYSGPVILINNDILAQGKGFDILTGKPKTIESQITGLPVSWEYSRNYGCNSPVGSKNLLTFRSAAAGYYDLSNNSGTGNFGGFRSSCTNNLIIAEGILSSPDYTNGCSCNYQNKTTLALIHNPQVESWTFIKQKWSGPIQKLGVNLGAPGDFIDDKGTLWIEFPSNGGPSLEIPIKVSSKVSYFNGHSLLMNDSRYAMVGASGAIDIETITLPTGNKDGGEALFTVNLYFSEPEDTKEGERLMDISIQGKVVSEKLDILNKAKTSKKVIVESFQNISAKTEIKIGLQPNPAAIKKATILNGVEIIAEKK